MNIGFALILAGVAQSFSGFAFFRQPGTPFFFFGPVWHASKYLTAPGVALWAGGSAVSMVGIILLTLTHL